MRMVDLDRPFDGIIAWHSIFHLPPADQGALIPCLAGPLAPGGMLLFTSGDRAEETIGEFAGEPLYHASLDPDEYRALLDEAGLMLIDHRLDDESCGNATVWLVRKSA